MTTIECNHRIDASEFIYNNTNSNRKSHHKEKHDNDLTHPFPYKKTYIDPQPVWNNLIRKRYTVLKTIDNKNWHIYPVIPNYDYYIEDGKQVKKTLVTSDKAYHEANILVDYFSEEIRVHARRKKGISPYDYFQQNYSALIAETNKVYADQSLLLGKVKPYNYYLREILYSKTNRSECSTFKISVVKEFCQQFGAKKILDPSAGWGDRILGAVAGGVQKYTGIDPNYKMARAYSNILNFIKSSPHPATVDPNQYHIHIADFLKWRQGPGETPPINEYDTVLTSPPFFSYEIYDENDPNQSIFNRKTVDEWLNGFLYPYIHKAWNALTINGHMALYISDVGDNTYVTQMIEYINNILGGYYIGVIAVSNEKLTRAFPLWVWKKIK